MGFQQGLSGLNGASKNLDVIGNNVANASTVGFKQSQAQFADVYANSVGGSTGSAVGIGTKLATVAQLFGQGNISSTSNPLDMAISQQGFFQLDNNGTLVYSRNGQFQLDKNGFIVNSQGHVLTGYAADPVTGAILQGSVVALQIPAQAIAPRPSTASQVGVNLDSRSLLPTGVSQANIVGNAIAGLSIIGAATPGTYAATIAVGGGATNFTVDGFAMSLTASPGNMASGASIAAALQAQLNAASAGTYAVSAAGNVVTIAKTATGPASLAPVIAGADANAIAAGFTAGTSTNGLPINNTMTVTVDGVASGTVTIPVATYASASALATAVQAVVNADPTLVAAGKSVTVAAGATGILTMTSNTAGVTSTIALANVGASNTVATLFGAAPVTTAGAGTFNPTDPSTYTSSTSLTIYDSLGNNHIATLYFQKTPVVNTWNLYMTVDNLPASGAVTIPPSGTSLGQLTFSTTGSLVTPPLGIVTVPGGGVVYTNGSTSPQPLTFDLVSTTQFGKIFGVDKLTQDGYASGQLNGFNTSADGTIMGRYTNGQNKALGQVLLANFANPQGLQPMGNNEWSSTADSGQPLVGVPGTASLGVLQSNAVEEANVDLTAELVNMIVAQRVYQANAQTIKAQDAILQTLVNMR